LSGHNVSFSPEIYTTPDSLYVVNHWWSFGDGSSSQMSFPSHTYAQCGTYTVYHITHTFNSNSVLICGDTVTQAITISCNTPCGVQAYFQGSPTTNQSNVYEFIDSSTVSSPNTGTITSVWNFGDGVTSSSVGLANQTHTYASSGTYTVCLYVYISQTPGTVSCADSFCQSIQVVMPNQQPCSFPATFNAVGFQNMPNVFGFTNTSQVDTTLAYATWTFGDGTSGGGDQITHTYTQSGVYNVCMHLDVFNTCSADTCIQLNVTMPNPTIDSCYLNPNFTWQTGTGIPNEIHFTNTTTGTDSLTTYTWYFGDSTLSNEINPSTHIYQTGGLHYVCLVADNNNGCVRETCHVISTSTPLASFPNPAQTNVSVSISLNQSSTIYATVYNAQSIMVSQLVQAGNAGNNILSFNISNLPAGLYTMRIYAGNQVYVSRFQKM
jgi:hypothetical protein